MKYEIVCLILQRLTDSANQLRKDFESSKCQVGVRHCIVDDLLPAHVASRIADVFPEPTGMRLIDSFRERKYTSTDFNHFDPLMAAITFAVQEPRVVEVVEYITSIKGQRPDSTLYAGGLSTMPHGHHRSPHIDHSHEAPRSYCPTLNLLYHVAPGWLLGNGGNLELWNKKVRKRVTIVSQFNRLVLMETTPTTWHLGSPVVVDSIRSGILNYYLSPLSPTSNDYFNFTSFSTRPVHPARRLLALADNMMHQRVRRLATKGLGKKDVYWGALASEV